MQTERLLPRRTIKGSHLGPAANGPQLDAATKIYLDGHQVILEYRSPQAT